MWGKVGHPAKISKSPFQSWLVLAILGRKFKLVKYYKFCLTLTFLPMFTDS